jgi:hypothetical protein
VRVRLIVLALGSFAIGTGSFVFAGPLEGVARDLSVSVGAAGNLVYCLRCYLCNKLPRARYARGERGAETSPRGGDGGVRVG